MRRGEAGGPETLCVQYDARMWIRVLAGLGAGAMAGILCMIASMGIDMVRRPSPNDGSYGMYGFVYGLILSPVAGILVAVLTYLWMRRRAKRSERADRAPLAP
jgi:uncharacterized membrane protein